MRFIRKFVDNFLGEKQWQQSVDIAEALDMVPAVYTVRQKNTSILKMKKNVSFVAVLAMEMVASTALRINIVMDTEQINASGVVRHQMEPVVHIVQPINTKNKTFIRRNENAE